MVFSIKREQLMIESILQQICIHLQKQSSLAGTCLKATIITEPLVMSNENSLHRHVSDSCEIMFQL